MKEKISVIIPAYNAEKYLHKCLDSILIQDYPNFEVIIVNDGSSDKTEEILNKYAEKDSRVIVISQVNSGHQKARATGIANATGEYATFVDSDDSLPSQDVLSMLNSAMYDDCDLAVGRINIDNENSQKIVQSDTFECLTKQEYLEKYLMPGRVGWQIYSKLFKLNILKQVDTNPIQITVCEDALFVISYLMSIDGVVRMVNQPVYNYYVNLQSITHKADIQFSLDGFNVSDYLEQNYSDRISKRSLVAFRLLRLMLSLKYSWLGDNHPCVQKTKNLFRESKDSINLINLNRRLLVYVLLYNGDIMNYMWRFYNAIRFRSN